MSTYASIVSPSLAEMFNHLSPGLPFPNRRGVGGEVNSIRNHPRSGLQFDQFFQRNMTIDCMPAARISSWRFFGLAQHADLAGAARVEAAAARWIGRAGH